MQRNLILPILLFCLFLDSNEVFSQANRYSEVDWSIIDPATQTSSDYVVLNSGEKVFGTIPRNYVRMNYSEVKFQSGNQTVKYNPSDIKGFGLDNGQLFFSRQLPGQSELSFVQILVSGIFELSEHRGTLFFDDGETYQRLDSSHEEILTEGETKRKLNKPYIFVMKTALSGDCGVPLYPKIDRLPYSQENVIRMLEDYYVCLGAPYTIHVEKIPQVKLSPSVGVGTAVHSLRTETVINGKNDQLGNNIGYHVFVGLRLHDFKKTPRLSMDLRMAYSSYKTTVQSVFEAPMFVWTGSEKIDETAIYVPLSVTYSVVKTQQSEVYLGAFLGASRRSITKFDGWETTKIKDTRFFPGINAGYNFTLSDQFKLFFRVEANRQREYYEFILKDIVKTQYGRDRISYSVGLEF
jgi:hypothetical protein